MLKQKSGAKALLIFVLGIASGLLFATERQAAKTPTTKLILDNARVNVTEITNAPQSHREPYTRPTDQVIVFLDEADYETTDAAGKKTVKHRAAGEVIWHNKGEAAPLLVNQGKQTFRSLLITLK